MTMLIVVLKLIAVVLVYCIAEYVRTTWKREDREWRRIEARNYHQQRRAAERHEDDRREFRSRWRVLMDKYLRAKIDGPLGPDEEYVTNDSGEIIGVRKKSDPPQS